MVVWYLHLETNRELKGLLKPERLCGGAPLPGINAAPPRRLLETKGVNGLSADRMRMKPKRNRLMLRTRFAGWKDKASRLKLEIYAIYLAYKDPRVPWYARVFAACVVGYAFSPIDLIPDPIPVLGYLDDLLLSRRRPAGMPGESFRAFGDGGKETESNRRPPDRFNLDRLVRLDDSLSQKMVVTAGNRSARPFALKPEMG